MTNLVYLAHNTTAPPAAAKVIIRIFGRGSFLFSRHQERSIFLVASRRGIGPQCLVEFTNGRVEQFLPGSAVTAASMRQPQIAAAIAKALSNFHTTMFTALPLIRQEAGDQMQGSSPRSNDTGLEDALWDRLRGWLAAAAVEAPEEVEELGLGGAEGEIDALEAAAESEWGPAWLALTHNDLQYGNVLISSDGLEREETSLQREENNASPAITATKVSSTTTATLIDYEYCTVGDIAFDIANHFCEYAADYHKSEKEDMLNWDRLPTPTETTFFCRKYVKALFQNHPSSLLAMKLRASCGISPTKQQPSKENGLSLNLVDTIAEVLVERVQAFMPLSHLTWGVWGLLQSRLSEVEFDYLHYARKRLQQYHETKNNLLCGNLMES
jgi:thiamine kinase-like enzyme